ncbi:MAG: DUF58 domain-containing protein, partial [Nitrospinota bacterium]
QFGSKRMFKIDAAAKISAMLAFSAIKNNDKVSFLSFTDTLGSYIAHTKRRNNVSRIIDLILKSKHENSKTNIGNALQFLDNIKKKRSIIFILSDFLDPNFEQQLAISCRKHKVIAIRIVDPIESDFQIRSDMILRDIEENKTLIARYSNRKARKVYQSNHRAKEERLNRLFMKNNVDHIVINSSDDLIEPLVTFFKSKRGLRHIR